MIFKSVNITFLTYRTNIPSRTTAATTESGNDPVRTGPMDTFTYSSIALKEKYIIHVNM